jgi:hypothetical protein
MWFWPDPGPCPVDDAPHTTCTSAEYDPTAPITIDQMPCRTAALAAEAARSNPTPATVTFTTKTYRRKLHHPDPRERGR